MTAMYRVQPGDTVASIARKGTGNPNRGREIVLANPQKAWMRLPNGQVSFQTLHMGEFLYLPNAWNMVAGVHGLPTTGLGAPADDLVAAQAALSTARNDFAQGESEATEADAMSDYQRAASNAATAASLANGAAQIFAQANARAAGLYAAASNMADSANSSVNDANTASIKIEARAAAAAGISAASTGIGYATQARDLPTSGGTAVPGIEVQWSSNTLTAASDLNSYLTANGCDCSTNLASVTSAFQSAYNSDAPHGVGTPDGKYGTGTRQALSLVLGSAAPAACWGKGNPCFGKQPGQSPSSTPVTPPAPVVIPPAPLTPLPPAPSKTPSWVWWALGAAGVAAAVGTVMYVEKKKSPARPTQTLRPSVVHSR